MPSRKYYRSKNWGTGELVELGDHSKVQVKKGDIIKLSNAEGVPKYARGCFGVVTRRYKTIKRLEQVFYNYGAEIMLLGGPKKGKTIRLMNYVSSSMKQVF